MDLGLVIVALTLIGCTYEILKRVLTPGSAANDKALLTEIRGLREEIRQLRQENHDVILGFDGSLQRVDDRVGRLEARTHLPGADDVSLERDTVTRNA